MWLHTDINKKKISKEIIEKLTNGKEETNVDAEKWPFM